MGSSGKEYRAWASDKQTVLAELCVELEEATETHLQLLVSGGGKLQIVIPSRYQLGFLDSTTDSNEEVFLVLTMGDVNSKMEASVLALNERLEQIRVNPNALHKVLDLLLIALKKLGFKRSRRVYEDGKSEVGDQAAVEEEEEEEGGGDETGSEGGKSEANYESDDEGDVNASCYDIAMGEIGNYSETENELRMRGSFHALAEEARKVCEDFQRGSARDMKNPLMWLRVLSKPMMLAVELQFEVVGMIDERIAAGLGFSLDAPVSLTLEFSKNTWSESSLQSEGLLRYESVTASQHSVVHNNLPPKTELDDIDRFLEASGGDRHRSYGLEVLFPELTSKFFANLNQETPIDDVHLEGFEYGMLNRRNPFICLAQFISLQLRLLPGWCLVCWKKLPFSVTRMRTCDDDLCLYRFEELGLGVSVLDEMKNNPTLVEVDISLAVCAAQSARDVFEPFPAFLLERQEIRGRSGWFSNNQGTNTTAKIIGNKRFDLLTRILSSIPPIDILKKCSDERALKKALTRAWYLHKYANFKLAPHGGPVGDNAAGEGSSSQYQHQTSSISRYRKIMEPTDAEEWKKEAKVAYDLTRFILMTNRLSLSLLSAENEIVKMVPGEEVQNRGIQYQFVVLHDAPEKEAYFTRAREEHGSFFAFHGSPAPNWYSILRNGLRSMSNTGYMSTGAAYGEGIYLATELNTSLVYARATAASWNNGTLKEGFQCIAICEVINGSPRESKPLGAGILVVPREKEQNVAIRYLMVLQPKLVLPLKGFKIDGRMLGDLKNPNIDLLKHYQRLRQSQEVSESTQQRTRMLTRSAIFLHALAAEESHVNPKPLVVTPSSTSSGAKSTGKSGSRAVMQEFNNLMKAINKSPPIASSINKGEPAGILSGTTVTIPDEDNNLSLWRISLHPYLLKESPNLYSDFAQLKRLRKAAEDVLVELEVKFPVNFPFEPPFVRVLSPRFKMHSGHVTVGGSICMELLTASGWSPACNFESLLVQVVMAFVEGEGRLDIDASIKGKNEYKESEAREAFLRAARAHGWKTT